MSAPRFERTYCSQCGAEFGAGDAGFSHCADHAYAEGRKNEREEAKSFPVIVLGFGRIEVANGTHEGKPALIFGRNGTGVIGEATQPNRVATESELLAVITFENVESWTQVDKHLELVRAALSAST